MATVTARKPRPKPAPAAPPAPKPDRALVAAEQYWSETRRPFVSLLFLAPLLIAYEIGVLWLGNGSEELLRNGADVWMRGWLYSAGVHQGFVLPIVVMALLLLWNFYGYLGWKVRAETLGGMLAESLIFAFLLVVAGQGSKFVCDAAGWPTAAIEASEGAREHAARALTFVGAGIYEEVLFRLLLLPACYTTFRVLQAGPRASAGLAVLATSLMFALAHYVGPAGDALVPYTFCFRAVAGVYFAMLFLHRGFGITVGAHAAYDLIVGVLWAGPS
jgi:membrane protease YdiL (CAAX protease family)